MAVFGKSGNLATLLRRVQTQDFRTTDELETLLTRLEVHPDLRPKQIAWMVGHARHEVREFGRSAGGRSLRVVAYGKKEEITPTAPLSAL